jgi:hypothetical protein
MVKFKRSDVVDYLLSVLGPGVTEGDVPVTVTGGLKGSIFTFEGIDVIRAHS